MEILGGIFLLLMSFGWAKIGSWFVDGRRIFQPPALLLFGIPCVVVALLALFVIYEGFDMMNINARVEQRKAVNEKLPPENVTASELIANKIRAENRYKDRHLNVTGTITNITKDIADIGATVTLNGKPSENEKGVSCKFMWDRYVESLSIGQTVTISGIYRYDNYMEKCSVYDLNPSSQSYSPAPKPEPAKSSNPVFDSMLDSALAGDAKAQFELSQAYFEGKIVQRNDTKGLGWLKKSAENDYPDALFELGDMYLNGFLVEHNHEKGTSYLKRAERLGHERAKFVLGLATSLMLSKQPSPNESNESFDAIRKKAEEGDIEAQYKLGVYYADEYFDNHEAIKWLFKANRQGHEKAHEKSMELFKADPDLWSWFVNNPDLKNW